MSRSSSSSERRTARVRPAGLVVCTLAAVAGCHEPSGSAPDRALPGDVGFDDTAMDAPLVDLVMPRDLATLPDARTDVPTADDVRDAPVATCFPACVNDLTRDCGPAGACVYQSVASTMPPYVARRCYANGVSAEDRTTPATFTTVSTYARGGRTCYSIETNTTGPGAPTVGTYRDAAGRLVATMSTTDSRLYRVECGGAVYMVDLQSAVCRATDSDAGAPGPCVPGTCP
jgi:hypothetical protein